MDEQLEKSESRDPAKPTDSAGEEDWASELSPEVRRILGIGVGPADEEDYHRYLIEKYGSR